MKHAMKFACLGVAAALVLPALVSSAAITPDQVKVKAALAATMTPEQLAAHKQRMADLANAGLLGPQTAEEASHTPADICTAATYEISTLPFGPLADTTVGAVDNFDLPADVTAPTCTAAATCAGAPSGAGSIYTGTGTGPDRAFRIRTDANCTLSINMDPTGAQDLALIVYLTQCSSSLADCVCVDDTGVGGAAEAVSLTATAGTDYFLVVDGYSSGAAPPGPSGPYTMAISSTSGACQLVPVELESFSID